MKYQLGTNDSYGGGYKTITIEELVNKMEDTDSIFHRFNRYLGGKTDSWTASLDIHVDGRILHDQVLLQFDGGEDECRMFEKEIKKLKHISIFKERQYPEPDEWDRLGIIGMEIEELKKFIDFTKTEAERKKLREKLNELENNYEELLASLN